jgi:hypothetical protein
MDRDLQIGQGAMQMLQRQVHDRDKWIDRVISINFDRSIGSRRVNDQALLTRLDHSRCLHLHHGHGNRRLPVDHRVFTK